MLRPWHVVKASQSDINNYFEKQVLKPQSGHVEHSQYGKIAVTEEPYKTEYNECLKQSFSGESFMFGELEVSDPERLKQYSSDYLMHRLAFIVLKNSRRDVSIKPIFDDQSFKPILNGIQNLTSRTLDCVKSKGWVYLPNKKSEK
ncbi:hypothetical protein [Pseudoalteromonas peptidolytica]|uniref:hypothetical protein n=2 Tax=Pseudoalteromonas peptidolytica TaxID=61150 RepID=UPI0014554498|nr:hypothetical protein [Pseudoalteromonas peptidolytica]NLR14269.1 hypothetical protein [Pseudoalteromonas peptidolytica]